MNTTMDERFATVLRAALIEHVQDGRARRWRARWRIPLAVSAAVLAIGGGVAAAAATGVLPLPGGHVVTPLAQPVTVDGVATQTVDLGTPPSGATSIDIKLTCLTAGTFYTADGASLQCDAADAGRGQMGWQLPVVPGQHTTTVRAGAGQRWRLVATYADVTTTTWGTNADGLTYGVPNERGTPDLVAVIATNGETGYVYAKALDEPTPANPSQALHWQNSPLITIHVPVYQPDGKTQIGVFDIRRHTAAVQDHTG